MTYSPNYSLKLASERRLGGRLAVVISGEALEIGKSHSRVMIKDLSAQGAMFVSEHDWKAGSRIWLFFPSGFTVGAEIIWTNRRNHGCQFLQRLSEGEFQLCLLRR
jgi:hypothetical protein